MNHHAYHRPRRLADVFRLAAAYPDARFIAGGTDLLVKMKRDPTDAPSALISLRSVEELNRVEPGTRLRIGAAVPLTSLVERPSVKEYFPALVESIHWLGSLQIQNVATLGGNLANASPAADTAPVLLVHEAKLELASVAGTREIPIEEFFLGPGQTALRPGELLSAVILDPPHPDGAAAFLRKGRVSMDLAIVNVAALVVWDGPKASKVRLAAGAVAPTPLRLTAAEAILEGSPLDKGTIDRAVESARAAIRPIDDLRGSAWYRTVLTGVLLKRALHRLLPVSEEVAS